MLGWTRGVGSLSASGNAADAPVFSVPTSIPALAMPTLKRPHKRLILALLPLAIALTVVGHHQAPTSAASNPQPSLCQVSVSQPLTLAIPSPQNTLLRESWQTYRDRFIQADGRVIDRADQDRTVSEGQAYAMLRAVAINDPATFERTYTWAKNNLSRRDDQGQRRDHLWAWHWGQRPDDSWGILDDNFATDADIDAATALIWAAQRWRCPQYLTEAQAILDDLWEQGTVPLPDGQRQLLPGPKGAFFNQPDRLVLNPSYFAPASFRLFAQVDPSRDWNSLIDSGYAMLGDLSQFSETGLPPDWVVYNPITETYRSLDPDGLDSDLTLQSRYSFDAIRVWWRVGQDAAWNQDPRAQAYLQSQLPELIQRWQRDDRLPARLSLDGLTESSYEATAHYAMLYPALIQVDPTTAEAIYRQKLLPAYQNGFWDSDTAYYTQNLAWFGLLPLEVSPGRLQSAQSSLRQIGRYTCPAWN
ncbi:MAG: glycosyl hydrolase family 8 [Leptolyngbya sp.]|nr:glycosyl hydrolase family 8 [Leptolyngbya sp.]